MSCLDQVEHYQSPYWDWCVQHFYLREVQSSAPVKEESLEMMSAEKWLAEEQLCWNRPGGCGTQPAKHKPAACSAVPAGLHSEREVTTPHWKGSIQDPTCSSESPVNGTDKPEQVQCRTVKTVGGWITHSVKSWRNWVCLGWRNGGFGGS